MDADDGRLGVDVAHNERDCAFNTFRGSRRVGVAGFRVGDDALKSKDSEMSPAGGEIGIGNLSYSFKRHSCDYTEALAPGYGA